MHLTKVEIKNLKSLGNFTWDLTENDTLTGWHVLLGDNGSGKSTFLRACAIALMGPKNAMGLRLPWQDWVQYGEKDARISISFTQDSVDQWTGKGNTTAGRLRATVKINELGITSGEISPSPNRHVWGWRWLVYVIIRSLSKIFGRQQRSRKAFLLNTETC